MFEIRRAFRSVLCTASVLVIPLAIGATMQSLPSLPYDPGVRAGPAGAGTPIAGLTIKEGKFFDSGLDAFIEVQSVQGTIPGTEPGLGPRFNLDSCGGCHAQPAAGGTSPAVNPQVAVATKQGATNTVPFFIIPDADGNGPVREARFKYADAGHTIRDGGVHDLFTITGRVDAAGCNLSQPLFDTAASDHNLIFRIPTPVFGAGLIESIQDSTIVANIKNPATSQGISGHENREGNAGTVSRFGWKAQVKSLPIFSGEAYNVEQGVANELFQQERDETAGCLFNPTPESRLNLEETNPQRLISDVNNFANFMRFLAPPAPVSSFVDTQGATVTSASIDNGRTLFASRTVGCALCHKPSMMTGSSSAAALRNQPANLYSDLLVHHMGDGLKDDIVQGAAGPDEFRTAPLWGLGQRIFFLHDGRTSNLLQAIQEHSGTGSEANTVIANFNRLSASQKQDILNFLRSL